MEADNSIFEKLDELKRKLDLAEMNAHINMFSWHSSESSSEEKNDKMRSSIEYNSTCSKNDNSSNKNHTNKLFRKNSIVLKKAIDNTNVDAIYLAKLLFIKKKTIEDLLRMAKCKAYNINRAKYEPDIVYGGINSHNKLLLIEEQEKKCWQIISTLEEALTFKTTKGVIKMILSFFIPVLILGVLIWHIFSPIKAVEDLILIIGATEFFLSFVLVPLAIVWFVLYCVYLFVSSKKDVILEKTTFAHNKIKEKIVMSSKKYNTNSGVNINLSYQMKVVIGYTIVLLLLCLAPMPYGYFILVRYVSMVVFGVMAYQFYNQKKGGLAVVCGALALLFQPFIKIALGRTMWNVVDVIVAIGLVVLFLVERENNNDNANGE